VRLISSRNIRDGVELARDVVAGPPGTAPLLRAGVKLSRRYVGLLARSGIGSVWIEDDLGADIVISEPLTAATRGKVHRATGTALREAGAALRSGSGMPSAVLDSLSGVAEAMVGDLLDVPDAALVLDDLHSFDSYTHRHSVQVTVLGLLIARRMWAQDGWTDYRGNRRRDRLEVRLRKLGLGLLIHDVGKLAVPPEILNKPGVLTDAEMAVMRTHPDAGVELLRSADLSPLVLSVVRDHHERPDGSGYPRGYADREVQEFPRIAAVADVYDAVTSERVYKPAGPPKLGVRVIREGAGGQFCMDVVRHFAAIVMPYPVGHEIALPDGRTGVVSSVDAAAPETPTVRLLENGSVTELVVDMSDGGEGNRTPTSAVQRPRAPVITTPPGEKSVSPSVLWSSDAGRR
jgi:HD-GYP domain-containing protein (c-di-GMP phosphodiesterase class II)